MISSLSFFLKEGMTSVLNSLVSKHIYVPKSINEHHIENQSLSATKSDMEAIFDTEFTLFPKRLDGALPEQRITENQPPRQLRKYDNRQS